MVVHHPSIRRIIRFITGSTLSARSTPDRLGHWNNEKSGSSSSRDYGATLVTFLSRRLTHPYIVCFVILVCFAPGSVFAVADGPDYHRVVDVTPDNVLNIRASPNTGSTVTGTIPHDADGIANFGCIGGLTLTEYEAAAAIERAAARKTRWCRVGYDRTIGWVAGWFLAEGGRPDSFRGGTRLRTLHGSEWQVRDFAGKSTDVDAWLAFKADGTVFGLAGCNKFSGDFTETASSLRFGSIAATRMACLTAKMRIERDLFKVLEATRESVATNLMLALFDDNGTLLATLTRRDWD